MALTYTVGGTVTTNPSLELSEKAACGGFIADHAASSAGLDAYAYGGEPYNRHIVQQYAHAAGGRVVQLHIDSADVLASGYAEAPNVTLYRATRAVVVADVTGMPAAVGL